MADKLRIFFLRHGQTGHSRDNLFCGSGTDATLTAAGEEMAQEFAARYSKKKWQGIYCSPQSRAQATVRPLCTAVGTTPTIRSELREIDYGSWEGKTVEEIEREYPQDHQRWLANPATCAPTGGETAEQIARRVMILVDEIRGKTPSGNVLMVSHKATIRVALCALLGLELSQYRFRLACPVCSLSAVEFTKNGTLLQFLADRSHLSDKLLALPGT